MAQRVADSRGTEDSPVTQALPGTPVSRVLAEFRGLRLSLDNAVLLDQPLGDWARQRLREREFPIADRDSQRVDLCIAPPMEIAHDVGIRIGTTIADAAHGSPVRMAMVIRDSLGTRTLM